MTVGERLKALRMQRGYSQDDVAKLLGIGRTTYLKYESGENKPSRKLKEIAALFGVTTDYLLGLELGNDSQREQNNLQNIFGKNLSKALKNRGMTQRDFAKAVGVSAAAVNEWLKGKKMPLMGRIDKICTVLSVERSELIDAVPFVAQIGDRREEGEDIDFADYIKFNSILRYGGSAYRLNDADKKSPRCGHSSRSAMCPCR